MEPNSSENTSLNTKEQKNATSPRSSLEKLKQARVGLLCEYSTLKRKITEIDHEINNRSEKIDEHLMKASKKTKLYADPANEPQTRV